MSPLTTRGASTWIVTSIVMMLLAIGLKAGSVGLLLGMGSITLLGYVGTRLVAPWMGERTCYRVRYHAADGDDLSAPSTARGLIALASEGSAIALIWRREQNQLALFVEASSALDEVVRGMLPRLLPNASIEVVATPPVLAHVKGFFVWSLKALGSSGTADPFNFENLLSSAVFVDDFELRVHLAPGDARVLVQGIAGPQAREAGVRPFLAIIQKCLPRGGTSWLVRLLSHYPFFDPLPQRAEAGVVTMHFPRTDLPITTRLDSLVTYVIPLPDDYIPPDVSSSLIVGISTADGRSVGLPYLSGEGHRGSKPDATAGWAQHFLAMGQSDADRNATVRMLLDQVIGVGGGLVHMDPHGKRTRQIASQLSARTIARRTWLDLENPAGSLHLNLLSVPPIAGPDNPAAAETEALMCALEDVLPLFSAYLEQLGAPGWSRPQAQNILVDWANVLLISHHRERLTKSPALTEAPVPDILTLYELLGEPNALRKVVEGEESQWLSPKEPLAAKLREAGDTGSRVAEIVQEILTSTQARLTTTTNAELRLLSAALRDQLRSFVHHPCLHRMWSAPMVSPATLLHSEPGSVVLASLPIQGDSQTAAAAARRYGLYLLSCVVAAARWRHRFGFTGPPVLLVLEDMASWLSGNMADVLQPHLETLGRAGIAMLATGSRLPNGTEGDWLLDNLDTWWMHNLSANDAGAVLRTLRKMGVTTELPFSGLPAGVSLLKVSSQRRPILATVRTNTLRNDGFREKPRPVEHAYGPTVANVPASHDQRAAMH